MTKDIGVGEVFQTSNKRGKKTCISVLEGRRKTRRKNPPKKENKEKNPLSFFVFLVDSDLVDSYGIVLSVMNAFNFDAHDRMQFHNDLSSYTT